MSDKASSGPLHEAVTRDPETIGGPVALIGGERLPESARHALRMAFPSGIIACSGASDFVGDPLDPRPSLILLCAGTVDQRPVVEALSEIVPDIPVIVLADSDDEDLAHKALSLGAKACIPLSAGLETAIAAMRFILASAAGVLASPH